MDMLPVDRGSAERFTLGTDSITVLATSEQTSGAIYAIEIRMPPGGGPPVLHRHAPAEIYHVLEGEFTFYVDPDGGGMQRITAGPGQVMPLAGNAPHAIRNEGDVDAVALSVHSPGGVMEGFTRAVVDRTEIEGAPPPMEAVLALAAEHGIELLGPIPGLADRRVSP